VRWYGCLAVLLAAGCSMPAPWARRSLPRPIINGEVAVLLPRFNEYPLNNGLTVWLWPNAGSPVVSAALALPLPGRVAGPDQAALQLACSLLDDGTADRDDVGLGAAFARLGADPTQWSTGAGTVVQATVLPEMLSPLLELMAEQARFPLQDEKVILARAREAAEQAEVARQGPESLGRTVLADEMGLPSHAVERAAFAAATAPRVREAQLELLDPRNAGLVVAGNFDEDRTLAAIQGIFEPWRHRASRLVIPPAVAPHTPRTVLVPWPRLHQTFLFLGRRLPPLDAPTEVALDVEVARYLGFLRRFRDEGGNSYGPQGGISVWRGGGSVHVLLPVDAGSTGPALRDSRQLLSRLEQQPPTRAELETARRLFSQAGAAAGDDCTGHVTQAADLFLRGSERDHPADKARALKVLSLEHLRVARTFLTADTMSVVLVGDPDLIRGAAREQGITLHERAERKSDRPAR